MSTSTDGILVYGYVLSDEDTELEFLDGDDSPSWYDEDADFVDQAVTQLLAAAFVAGAAEDDDLYKSSDEATALLGVEIVIHCSDRSPGYLLAAKAIDASRGYPQVVDLSLPDGADERLSWALGVLGIKPKAQEPTWLLTSYWG